MAECSRTVRTPPQFTFARRLPAQIRPTLDSEIPKRSAIDESAHDQGNKLRGKQNKQIPAPRAAYLAETPYQYGYVPGHTTLMAELIGQGILLG
jgi:hypothetical protein